MWRRGDPNAHSTSNGVCPSVTGSSSEAAAEPAAACREASHAGSWYTANGRELERELSGWIQEASCPPDRRVRAVIAPHAGFRYSGRCAAYAFSQIDPSSISRIFLLGPSHHHFTRRCMLTTMRVYTTPLGDIPIDTQVVAALRATGEFEDASKEMDEAEHSLEMHLPYLYQIMKGRPFTLVPIIVGSLTPITEAKYGKLLEPFLSDPGSFFSVSSDFCHWGTRFGYTPYDTSCGAIHKSIEALDREGMSSIETGTAKPFTVYLGRTENTICGRHPIGVLLNMIERSPSKWAVRFVRYEQSSQCRSVRDSSVSYASGIVQLQED